MEGYHLKNWHKLKVSEDKMDVDIQSKIEKSNDKWMIMNLIEKVAYTYAYYDSNLSKIHKFEKYLENHNLAEYKGFFYAKIITNRYMEITDGSDDKPSDYPDFYRFIDQIASKVDACYKNEDFYDCLLKHYIKKALLCDSEKEINKISDKIYKLFNEFETFKGSKLCGEFNVFENEDNDKIKLHTKNFYKNLLDFYATKMHDFDKVFEIGEYVVWTLNIDMNAGFYSDLATVYINLINEHKDINGKTLSSDVEQDYFQKVVELNEKINELPDFAYEECTKVNSFESLYKKILKNFFDNKKFSNIINAFKNLSENNKSTTYILKEAANAYIIAKEEDDYSSVDKIITDIKDNVAEEFYERIIGHYARRQQFRKACLCSKIAMNNCCLRRIDQDKFKQLNDDFEFLSRHSK